VHVCKDLTSLGGFCAKAFAEVLGQ